MKSKWTLVVVLVGSVTGVDAGGPDPAFMSRIPSSANAVMYMDVSAAYLSPIGRREEWAKRYSQTQHASLNSLPPTVEQALVAVQYDLHHMAPIWRIGLMRTDWLVRLGDIARRAGSVMEDIAGRSAVFLPRGAYVTAFDGRQLGTIYPANRQAFARWIEGINVGSHNELSPYIRGAINDPKGATMVVAVDLKYAVDERSIHALLAKMPTLKGNAQNAASLAKLFAGIKGFTLSATMTDQIQGKLKIDFAGGAKAHSQYLPAVVEDLLGDGGLIVDDFRDWTPTIDDNSMVLEGRLSSTNLHRILSLFELPGDIGFRQLGDQTDAPAEMAQQAIETRRYFNTLSDLLTELRNVRMLEDRSIDDRFRRYAFWYEAYAQKIDQLNTRHVDPDLAQFGSQLAYSLRAITSSLRGVPMKIDALDQTIFSTGWSWWGGGSTNAGQVREQQGQILVNDVKKRQEIWRKIDEQMLQFKTKLSEKYRMPF